MKRLLGVLAVLALPVASASATGVVQVESSTSGQTVSDGARYVSWTVGADVRVLDDQSGAVASYPLPAGCRAPSALGRGAAASVCGTRIQLLNVLTGTWAALPETAAAAGLLSTGVGSVTGVGRHWLSVTVESNRSYPPEHAGWINRATGELVVKDPGDRHEYADLDARHLWRRLCAPLQRYPNPEGGEPRLVAPRMSGSHALDLSGRYPVLRRCGSDEVHVLTRSSTAADSYIWFSDNRVSWYELIGSRALGRRGEACKYGCIRAYDIDAGKYRTWHKTPFAVNVVHTRQHIFFDDEEDIVDDVAARFRVSLRR